jgi:hypothetical protein
MGRKDNGGGAPLWSAMISARSGGAVRTVDRDDDWDENHRPQEVSLSTWARLTNWVRRNGA